MTYIYKLQDMVKGWFIGDFEPVVIKTGAVEVAVKTYKQGDYEDSHHHRIATEVTVIISGKVEMKGRLYMEGDIIQIDPYESTDFRALEDTVTCVVKYPGAKDDKYVDKEP
jgi:quercetin dioxygenase-like cupin family protein